MCFHCYGGSHCSSSAVMLAVPGLPNTIPPARFAKDIDFSNGHLDANATARVAITVSPAPEILNICGFTHNFPALVPRLFFSATFSFGFISLRRFSFTSHI